MSSKLSLALCLICISNLCLAIKEPLVAPYVDVTRMDNDYLVKLNRETGLTAVTLAFVLGGGGKCEPAWGAESGLDNPEILTTIKNFQAIGGKVILATGGAVGPYLESTCTTSSSLVSAYKKVLSTLNTKHLDIDIETTVALDNMNAALVQLDAEVPDLTISYTLMVQGDDYGLNDFLGVAVLQNAAKHGVKVDMVNAMTMEFSSTQASWGDAVIGAAESTHKQMKLIWPTKSDEELYAMLGVTPMIGKNFNGRIFETAHARQLVAWAKQKKVGHLSFWSLGRDNGKCPGGAISADCSSIAQSDLEFSKIFQEYASTQIPTTFPNGPSNPVTNPPTQAPWTQPPVTQPPVTQAPIDPSQMDCSVENRHYPHESDCSKYYWCYGGTAHVEQCAGGTVWDQTVNVCNFASEAHRTNCH